MYENILSSEAVGSAIQLDDRFDALLSITGRMAGYRCRNDAMN